ncbi:apolipoprotein D-like isoform X2 [Eriocheir sinensis]|uniref:apolipoprotein D-like isoform X2 n=1 Tax=Eriocheir sinensis TaxID=95602 RepID=UPI0021C8DD5C|nr:apolipoprotein D-like isoform X2 [Eriocheir sinensis]
MKSVVLVLVLVVVLVGVAEGGTCPKYPIIRDFDFQRYMGLWYQQDKRQASWEAPGRCWRTLYSRDRKNGQFKMKMIFESTLTNRVERYDSQLTLQGPAKPSLIKYSIPLTFMEDEFQVLATDYESFALEYKCDPNGILEKQESIWLLTREKTPSPLVLQRAYAIMHHLGIDIRKLERVDQTCGGIDLVPASVPTPAFFDYDYYDNEAVAPAPGQAQENVRRQHQYEYDYADEYPDTRGHQHQGGAPGGHLATSESQQHEQGQQGWQPSNFFAVSYPSHPSDTPVRHRVRPYRHQVGARRKGSVAGGAGDERLTLGQSLATRLWHVLHTPIKK